MQNDKDGIDRDTRIALARYEVISAYLALGPSRGHKRKLLESLAARAWIDAEGQPLVVTAETLRAWVRRYRRGGLHALRDKSREKRGVSVLTPEQCELVCRLKEDVPERSLERIIRIAEELSSNTMPKSTQRQGRRLSKGGARVATISNMPKNKHFVRPFCGRSRVRLTRLECFCCLAFAIKWAPASDVVASKFASIPKICTRLKSDTTTDLSNEQARFNTGPSSSDCQTARTTSKATRRESSGCQLAWTPRE